MAVIMELSTVKASAANGARSLASLLTNSAAKCCASAAEPPLPAIYNLPDLLYDAITTSVALLKISNAVESFSNFCFASIEAIKFFCNRLGLFMSNSLKISHSSGFALHFRSIRGIHFYSNPYCYQPSNRK